MALKNYSPLEALPDEILLHSIYPLMDMSTLGRLACCSKRLSHTATMDHLWFPLYRGLDVAFSRYDCADSDSVAQPPPQPWLSWHQLFCYRQNRRCVECQRHSPYIFTLSQSRFRLCERCEQTCPKYALVTEREAKGRFLVTDGDLSGLLFKRVCHKRFSVYFFLKSDIECVSSQRCLMLEDGNVSQLKSKQAEDVELEGPFGDMKVKMGHRHDETAEEGSAADEETLDGQLHEDFQNVKLEDPLVNQEVTLSSDTGQSSAANHEELMQERVDIDGRIHKREMRKEHKRQVKAAKRDKRLLQSTATLVLSGSSHSTLQLANEPKDSKNRGKCQKWRTKREHLAASSGSFRQGETVGCNPQLKNKSPSDWVREREWLEVELGPYGFSALELAPP